MIIMTPKLIKSLKITMTTKLLGLQDYKAWGATWKGGSSGHLVVCTLIPLIVLVTLGGEAVDNPLL